MKHKKINEFILEPGGQWIQWKRNPPTASNKGGVWERQIRYGHSVLLALLKIHGTSLNDESLRTLLAKVEANTRPIISESLLDVHSPIPLCPMQLLTIKSCLPQESSRKRTDCRKQWGLVGIHFGPGGRRKFMQPCKFVINETNYDKRSGWRHCFVTGGDE